ncbi:TIGR00269 family protein [Candidatus Thorarchaeota archaeon]|nr:MAG: TIGR00269 family protein [Candidatus Thorarchaeota archaeon]
MGKKCSKCGETAVYLRRYTNERLCVSCLVKTTQERVRKTINRLDLLRDDDRIVVAISGGKDSAVLLDVLTRIEKSFPRSEIVPLTIDEGIKGYRNRALEAARGLVDSLGLELIVRTFSDYFGMSLDEMIAKREPGSPSACSYCGVFRRRALNEAAKELEGDVLATGHILDDEAQTIVMNVLRGDTKRMARTNTPRVDTIEGFVPRIKPLSQLSERDIVAYAHFLELPYHDVPCPYASEAYRNDIREFLNQMEYKRPGTLLAILYSGETIADALREDTTSGTTGVCERCGEPTTGRICKVCGMLRNLRGER